MRTILFRGKMLKSGAWIEGDLRQYPSGAVAIKDNSFCHIIEVDPASVCQYTGLKDKNGKKIFEGDIVEQSWFDCVEPIDDSVGEVVYCENDCSFSVMDANKKEIVPLGRCHSYHWEVDVIGNIHDNPELMEA